ncbi:MAG: V-type ATP synthase subunit B [Oscillospiraceae bacterium]|nr:V-type ATP synthase subunit B [Oscillospiraceae bacterium]
MIIKYKGAKEIRGSLLAVEGVKNVCYEELARIELDDGSVREGKVVLLEGDIAVIQVFEGTSLISLSNTQTQFSGRPMEIAVSKEILGRVFNGTGKPLDELGEVFSAVRRDVNGVPMNPVARVYPQNYICTGISSIDVLITLVRGQKLPIFSGPGMKHNELASQISRQASIAENEDDFVVVFAAMGVKSDVAAYFRSQFEESGVIDRVVMFLNLANDPVIERILAPRCAITAAEYLAFELDMHVLVIMTDMTAYAEALREFSSSIGEIPGYKGYPGYLYSDLASIYERAGVVKGKKGSLTQIPILTMPDDDITHPVPDLTGYITEGQIVFNRSLEARGVSPAIAILPSLSRLMKDGIGQNFTRKDHKDLSSQLFAAYAKVIEIRSLASVIGEDSLVEINKTYLKFGKFFESEFINQGMHENRSINGSLDLGWKLLSLLPRSELDRVDSEILDEFYIEDKDLIDFSTKLDLETEEV